MKKLYIALLILAAIAAATTFIILRPHYIEYKDPALAAVDKEIFEERVRDAQERIENFNNETPQAEKLRIYMYLARAQFSLGLLSAAEESYEEAIATGSKDPLLANVWYELYNVRYNRENYKGARDAIRKAIDLSKTNVDYWRALINVEVDGLKISEDKLQNLYLFAIRESGNNADVIALYANYLESKGDLQGALEQWRKILEIVPGSPPAIDHIKLLEQKIQNP